MWYRCWDGYIVSVINLRKMWGKLAYNAVHGTGGDDAFEVAIPKVSPYVADHLQYPLVGTLPDGFYKIPYSEWDQFYDGDIYPFVPQSLIIVLFLSHQWLSEQDYLLERGMSGFSPDITEEAEYDYYESDARGRYIGLQKKREIDRGIVETDRTEIR
jgi:hypothetical protein